eukprot:UN11828
MYGNIITKFINYQISVEILPQFDGSNWFSDRILNSWCDLLNKQQENVSVLCLESWIAAKWSELRLLPNKKHKDYDSILEQHRQIAKYIVDKMISEKIRLLINHDPNKQLKIRTLLLVINLGNRHWIYGEVAFNEQKIIVHDSLEHHTKHNMKNEALLFYKSMGILIPQYLILSKEFSYSDKFDLTRDKMKMKKGNFDGSVKQYNGSDCGVYVCLRMEAKVNKKAQYIKL